MPTNDNIIWETMSSLTITPYKTLYEELLDKCNPQKFMQPYDKHKVDVAIDITDQLKQNQSRWHDIKDNELTGEFRQILTQAINELGIFVTAQRLFDILRTPFVKYISHNDTIIAHNANAILGLLNDRKNDILQLDELSHSALYKEYLTQIHKIEEEKAIEQDRKEYQQIEKESNDFLNKINTSDINGQIGITESQQYKVFIKRLKQYKGNYQSQINDIIQQFKEIEKPIKIEIDAEKKKGLL